MRLCNSQISICHVHLYPTNVMFTVLYCPPWILCGQVWNPWNPQNSMDSGGIRPCGDQNKKSCDFPCGVREIPHRIPQTPNTFMWNLWNSMEFHGLQTHPYRICEIHKFHVEFHTGSYQNSCWPRVS